MASKGTGKQVGRKTKLTPSLIKKVCKHVEDGLKYVDACMISGISESAFYDWQARGEKEPDTIYGEFLAAIKRAQVVRKAVLLEKLDRIGEEHWQSVAWRLERGFPDEFGKTKVEHEGTINIHFDKEDENL